MSTSNKTPNQWKNDLLSSKSDQNLILPQKDQYKAQQHAHNCGITHCQKVNSITNHPTCILHEIFGRH